MTQEQPVTITRDQISPTYQTRAQNPKRSLILTCLENGRCYAKITGTDHSHPKTQNTTIVEGLNRSIARALVFNANRNATYLGTINTLKRYLTRTKPKLPNRFSPTETYVDCEYIA